MSELAEVLRELKDIGSRLSRLEATVDTLKAPTHAGHNASMATRDYVSDVLKEVKVLADTAHGARMIALAVEKRSDYALEQVRAIRTRLWPEEPVTLDEFPKIEDTNGEAGE